MPIYFKDPSDGIEFEYYDTLPSEARKLNTHLLKFYWLYRNSVYTSYKKKPDLAQDIKEREAAYEEKDPKLAASERYKDPLHHYSVAVSLDAMKKWKNPNKKMHCYIAYQNNDGEKTEIGFVHFKEKIVDGKPAIYIAQAGVLNQGKHVGRRLMECVLAHYPSGTQFYILTRVFNTEAKNLYGERLKFKPIGESQIKQLGYDARYCGYEHTTSPEDIAEIKAKLKTNDLKRKRPTESNEVESEQVKPKFSA